MYNPSHDDRHCCRDIRISWPALIDLARNDMATRLGVRPKEIAIQSTEPLSFPPGRAGAEGAQQAGYVIRLAAGGQECRYSGRPLGDTYVLWREIQ